MKDRYCSTVYFIPPNFYPARYPTYSLGYFICTWDILSGIKFLLGDKIYCATRKMVQFAALVLLACALDVNGKDYFVSSRNDNRYKFSRVYISMSLVTFTEVTVVSWLRPKTSIRFDK